MVILSAGEDDPMIIVFRNKRRGFGELLDGPPFFLGAGTGEDEDMSGVGCVAVAAVRFGTIAEVDRRL